MSFEYFIAFVAVVCVCLFFNRKLIAKLFVNLLYKAAQGSMDSCSGKVAVDVKGDDRLDEDLLGDHFVHSIHNKIGFLIDAKSVGQDFDIVGNKRFCTPSRYQDLYPTDLA